MRRPRGQTASVTIEEAQAGGGRLRARTARALMRPKYAAARLVRAAAHPRLIRAEAEVALDARRYRAANPFLPTAGPRSGPRALVVSLTDWPYQLKIEGMLLKALDLAGYRPSVLTSAPIRARAARYLDAYGFDDLRVIEDYEVSPDRPDIHEAVHDVLQHDITVQRLKDLQFRDTYVGRHVLSSISRGLLQGSVDLRDRRAAETLATLLPRSMALCLAAERMLDDIDPDVVIFNEARYAGYGPIFETALRQRRNVVQFVHAFSDDALVVKRYTAETSRFHPRSLGEQTWAEVAAGPWNDEMERELAEQFDLRYAGKDMLSRRLHERTQRRSRSELTAELGLDPSKPTAVVFSHVLWDANLFYGEDLFEDQGEWLVETVREAAATPDVNWVVKLHPANVWKLRQEGFHGEMHEVAQIRERVGPLPSHVKLLMPETEVSTISLFELADWGITIRGTVGVELPCYGVPMLTAGTSHYSGRGFTVDSATAEEYRSRLRHIREIPPLTEEQTIRAKKHAHALFCRRPLRFTSFRTTMDQVERMGHPLDHNIEVTLRSEAELRGAPDLRAFAEWAVDREREDYVAPLDVDGGSRS
jgi:hypothetical protein